MATNFLLCCSATFLAASERANYQLFLVEKLCDVLGLPHPEPATD